MSVELTAGTPTVKTVKPVVYSYNKPLNERVSVLTHDTHSGGPSRELSNSKVMVKAMAMALRPGRARRSLDGGVESPAARAASF